MRTGLIFVSVVVVLCLETTSANLFSFPCPPNCASRTCTPTGCTRCQSGYSIYYSTTNRIAICLRRCPTGYYGHTVGFCTQCRISNCEACSARNTCTQCSRRYELNGNGGCRRQ